MPDVPSQEACTSRTSLTPGDETTAHPLISSRRNARQRNPSATNVTNAMIAASTMPSARPRESRSSRGS